VFPVGTITNQSVEVCVGDAIVATAAIGTGEAVCVNPFGGTAAAFDRRPGRHRHGWWGRFSRGACRRQFGQSSGVRGLRSRWTRAVASVHSGGEEAPSDHVQASRTRQSSSRSRSQHQSGSISDLAQAFGTNEIFGKDTAGDRGGQAVRVQRRIIHHCTRVGRRSDLARLHAATANTDECPQILLRLDLFPKLLERRWVQRQFANCQWARSSAFVPHQRQRRRRKRSRHCDNFSRFL
jgi:hypothetical protein